MNICRVDEENHQSIIILIELKYYLKINRMRKTHSASIVFRSPDICLLLHEMIMYIVACNMFLASPFLFAIFFIILPTT